MRTAFFDAPILISSLNVVKTFILFGDVHKGIYFVQYRDQVSCGLPCLLPIVCVLSCAYCLLPINCLLLAECLLPNGTLVDAKGPVWVTPARM